MTQRITTMAQLKGADLLTLEHLTGGVILEMFEAARRCKAAPRQFARVLEGRSAALLFEKPSLRTKMSFEVGIFKLGGQPVFMDHSAQRLGARESVRDYAKNLERWVDCIIARVYSHSALVEMAETTTRPVINALCDRFHPCQALADYFTLFERCGHDAKTLRATKLAYVGDGNNVCHSLMHAAALLGSTITVITPKGFAPAEDVTATSRRLAGESGGQVTVTHDLGATEGHDAVYTDVWVSMGQAGGVDEVTRRRKVFQAYQVDSAMMDKASRGRSQRAVFMHCLPAQRGLEVTDDVIDSAYSVVYDQAENRMWAQNALLAGIFQG